MTAREIHLEIQKKGSCLCVGLDTDPSRLPSHFAGDPDAVFHFNKAIVEATHDLAVAYKPNLAFYEATGAKGMVQLEKTVDFIRSLDPNLLIIADAKRGDIGNTADQYARSIFIHYDFDAVTLSPYMGRDSIDSFLKYDGKWAILLGLTSNPGSHDLQLNRLANGEPVFLYMIRKSAGWGSPENMMFVVGATHPDHLVQIREVVPDHFLLVPGVGAQGGSLDMVLRYGMNALTGLLINSSRAIIYAGSGPDFAEKARGAALQNRSEMSPFLKK